MSKKLTLALVAATLASPAFAVENNKGHMYLTGNLGYLMNSIKTTDNETDILTGKKTTESIRIKPRGVAGSLGVGSFMSKETRIEAEVFYGNPDKSHTLKTAGYTETQKLHDQTWGGFLNVYYDFHNNSMFVPYLTAGIGASNNRLKYEVSVTNNSVTRTGSVKSKSKTSFAYKIGAGAAFRMAKNADFLLDYRLMQLGERKMGSRSYNDEFTRNDITLKRNFSHYFGAGLRFTF